MIPKAVRNAVERALGTRILEEQRLSGGDINDAFEVKLEAGRSVFLKTNANAPVDLFAAEARGLRWLETAQAIRLPEVLCASAPEPGPSFLVLELVRPAKACAAFDEELGRSLAALHRHSPAAFGLEQNGYIGTLPQSNRPRASWAEFYREERLLPQLALARARGRATSAMQRGFERLFERLAELCGPAEPPSRLHGDLWGGNLHVDERGQPCLIDPAAYGGHREVDLAMMKLFGGFGPRVFSAYAEAFPLALGYAERVPLYQLYPLMVHVNLFGGGYAHSVERALAEYA